MHNLNYIIQYVWLCVRVCVCVCVCVVNAVVGEKSPTAEPAQGKHGERRGSLKMRDKDLKRRATRTRNLGIALKYFKKLDMDNSGAIDVNEFSTFFQSKDLEDLIENAIEKEDNIVTENLSKEDANMLRQFFNFLDSDQR